MAKSSGGSRKLLWSMMVLLILSSSAAAVALYMVLSQPENEAQSALSAQEVPEPPAPIFLPIEPFTVNLADDQYGPRLLYTGLSLKLGDEQSQALLEQHMPQVRSRLLMLFSGKQAGELTSPGGKQRLAEQVIAALEAPMSDNQPELAIDDVLFTEFIVQ
ncbi:flagellar basal body-associated protein FliL [Halomonas saccharevitans]|uniref:Flagellar protein FliL n=1 Tax=Halomonas saccharevitans TaxID=416872 RepID=A0A1I6YZL7_9GAMM|nr:flagellar basal body-associated protein FliL [Halomonas saccharevitans]SFT55853.1 flagellar FliL protein [Halomonas saccharevitans]